MWNLTKDRKQPEVVILQQADFYNILILYLWLRITRRFDQSVQFMNFQIFQIFLCNINHGQEAAVLKKSYLWVLLAYIAVAISIAFRQYFKMFKVDNMKETRLNRYVYDFSVDFSTADVSDIMDIQQYLMKKNNVKWCSNLLNKLLLLY